MPVDLELAHRTKLAMAEALTTLVDARLDDKGLIETRDICLIGIGMVVALSELMSPLPTNSVQVLADELMRLHEETALEYQGFAATEGQTIQ